MMVLVISDYTSGNCYIVPIPEDIELYIATTFKDCNIDWFTTDSVMINPSCDMRAIKYEAVNT